MRKNDEINVQIIDNGMELEGIAKKDGLPIFIPYCIEGEEVLAKVVKKNTAYAIGKLVKVVQPSKYRVAVDCKAFFTCGGCSARHIEYKETLKMKKQNVINTLKKQGIDTKCVGEIYGMGLPYNYRNKVQYPVVNIDSNMHIGMYAPMSHRLVEFDECYIQNKEIDKMARAVFEKLSQAGFNGYCESTNTGDIRNIICRIGINTDEIMCIVVINDQKILNDKRLLQIAKNIVDTYDNVKSFQVVVNETKSNKILTDKIYTICGRPYIEEILGDYTFQITANSFFQVNTYQAEVLYNLLQKRLELTQKSKLTLLELYSGVGSIGIFLSKYVDKVYGVEIVESAVEAAKNNCKINNVNNATYVCRDASEYISEMQNKGKKFDILIVDPPRKGLDLEGIEAILASSCLKIGYVSCNMATLARDIKLLSSKYNVKSIDMVDMFPYTRACGVYCGAKFKIKQDIHTVPQKFKRKINKNKKYEKLIKIPKKQKIKNKVECGAHVSTLPYKKLKGGIKVDNKLIGNEKDIIFYEDNDGNIKIEVMLRDENVWLNSNAIANLFNVDRSVITKHINNIYKEEELEENSTCAKIAHKGNDEKQTYKTKYYNLDMIISIGFRVNSKKAIKFRNWANKLIKEYIIKGFNLNDDRFINGNRFDAKFFDELLERIKTIRISERMSYQKITDLFIATSVDYDKNSEEAYTFFKIVQNKLHYAITGCTAAELIYERVNSEKLNLGLTNWKNSPDGLIYKYDVSIAKNYLNEEELDKLKRLTISFLDYAEDMALEQNIMTMKDWINETDELLKFRKKNILSDSGKISHKKAIAKAENEYDKFRLMHDQEYISSMDEMYQKYLEENKK